MSEPNYSVLKSALNRRTNLAARAFDVTVLVASVVSVSIVVINFIVQFLSLRVKSYGDEHVPTRASAAYVFYGVYGAYLAFGGGVLAATALAGRRHSLRGSIVSIIAFCTTCVLVVAACIVLLFSDSAASTLSNLYVLRDGAASSVSDSIAASLASFSASAWDVEFAYAFDRVPTFTSVLVKTSVILHLVFFGVIFVAALALYTKAKLQTRSAVRASATSSAANTSMLANIARISLLIVVSLAFICTIITSVQSLLLYYDSSFSFIYRHGSLREIASVFIGWTLFLIVSSNTWLDAYGSYAHRCTVSVISVILGVLGLAAEVVHTVILYTTDECARTLRVSAGETETLVCNVHCEQSYTECTAETVSGAVLHDTRVTYAVVCLVRCVLVGVAVFITLSSAFLTKRVNKGRTE